jgi:hypothetical protein
MKTKKDRNYSFEHTKKRLEERYYLHNIDINLYNDMCEKIVSKNGAIFVKEEKQGDDTQIIYDLTFAHRFPIRVVWSEKRQCITTALKGKKWLG